MLEAWCLDGDKMGGRFPAPNTIHVFAEAVTDQTTYLGIIYGSRRRETRIKALRFLLEINDGAPDLFDVEFIGNVWGDR